MYNNCVYSKCIIQLSEAVWWRRRESNIPDMAVSLRLVELVNLGRQPGYGVYVNLIVNLKALLWLIHRMVDIYVEIHTDLRALSLDKNSLSKGETNSFQTLSGILVRQDVEKLKLNQRWSSRQCGLSLSLQRPFYPSLNLRWTPYNHMCSIHELVYYSEI